MTFITAEPYIGHLGLGGVGDTKGLLKSHLRDRDIKWITNAKIDRFAADKVDVTELDEDGAVKGTHEVPFRLATMIPAFRGIDALNGAKGGIPGTHQPARLRRRRQVPMQPDLPQRLRRGRVHRHSAVSRDAGARGRAQDRLHDRIHGRGHGAKSARGDRRREPTLVPTWNAVCLADFGDSGVAFVALPQIPPRNVNWSSGGYWVHLAKIGFEKYFLRKVRNGSSEPGYERFLLKTLGASRLREPERAIST